MAKTLAELREYQKAYYAKNREKVKEYQREYQKKYRGDKEAMDRKAKYMREYNKTYMPLWNSKPENKEKRKKYLRKYWEKNYEKLKKYSREYYQTPRGHKITRINNWKQIGIRDQDLSAVYDIYIKEKHCWICGNEYTKRKERHLDHDHDTGEIRYICCRSCNINILSNNQSEEDI